MARQYHPDVNPGDKEAEEKFKSINEAYQVLSNAEQRKKYDEMRVQYQQWQQSGTQGRDFNWQNWSAQPGQNANVRYATAEDLEDLFGDENPFSDFFTSIFGQTRGQARPAGPRKGQDVEAEVDLTLEEAAQGTARILQVGDSRIEAKICRVCKQDRECGWLDRAARAGTAEPQATYILEFAFFHTRISSWKAGICTHKFRLIFSPLQQAERFELLLWIAP